MRLNSIAAGAVLLAAATFWPLPAGAVAAADQPTHAVTCQKTTQRCEDIGSVFDWTRHPYQDDIYFLERGGTNECLTTDGGNLFLDPCPFDDSDPLREEQLWEDVTPEGQVGAVDYRNVAYRHKCATAVVAPGAER
ncbi:MAG: hypothetical protein HOV94_05020 [Saccharothrix sp.]|nr:hypothetical protein [Saccharothrix sp.]